MARVLVVAAVAVLALGGCMARPADQEPDVACPAFAACLFLQEGPLAVVVHSSSGMPFPEAGLAALADQVAAFAGRPTSVSNGSAVGPLPDISNDTVLHSVGAGGPPDELHVYVLDTVRLEGDEPTSGLSFPGSGTLFLFPATLDRRVAEAGLDEEAAGLARATLEAVVLAHEFGHALGLVGCGIPMQAPHADPASSCHSANTTSLMHAKVARVAQWPAWEAGAPLGPFGWDADDLADVAAFRESPTFF